MSTDRTLRVVKIVEAPPDPGGIQQSFHRFPILVRVGHKATFYKLQIRTLLIHEEE